MTASIARSINIRTEIPGPRSRELVARRQEAMPIGLGKAHQIAVERAEGALVTDVDGNTFIDFVGGIGVLNAGHCPPEVVAAIQAQAAKLLHFSALVGTYEPYVELAERLNAAVPIGGPCKTILSNSGAEGVENAVKFARAATGRQAIVAFEGGYHGRTLMTLSLTSKTSFKKALGPFAPEIYRAPYPYAYRMGVSEDEAERRPWATVNKESGGGNKSGSGRGKPDTHVASRKGGKLGGEASASRPKAERSAAAKKAAATRRRNAAHHVHS